MTDIRIGNGYDVHALAMGLPLCLGGIHIEDSPLGCVAHSDGDVALHALCDALLGCLALRDIGHHFPDTDPRYEGADSMQLLKQVGSLLDDYGFTIGNVDATIIAQNPKLAPYRDQMRQNVARVLAIPVDCVSIKATTEEHLGFTGREEGIAAQAVALLI